MATSQQNNNEADSNPEEDQDQITMGISSKASERDKALFVELRDLILKNIMGSGHDYTPGPFEYRASSIGMCSRKIILDKNLHKYMSEEEIHNLPEWYLQDLEQFRITGTHIPGQIIHEVIQTALEPRIHSIEEEVSIKIGVATLKGHYDLLLEYPDGEKIVIDIKSTSAPRSALPNKKHLRQLLAYQSMLGGIQGALLYVHRNTFEMTYVPQEYNKDEFSNKIVLKVINLANSEQEKKLPPATSPVNFIIIASKTPNRF